MKIQTIGAIALSAAMALASSTALAHGPHGNYRGPAEQGYGPMMGQGYGPMMGQGQGPMMGQSYGPMMGQGQGPMMGQGYGPIMGQQGYGPMMGQGQGQMMGRGYGPMMGHGCGSMMGQGGMMGMMHPGGMMGYGHSPMMGRGMSEPLAEDLSLDGVRHIMTHRVAMMQNPNLKVGEVSEVDDDTITADVVTQDGSLVWRYMVDRHTGAMRSADMEE